MFWVQLPELMFRQKVKIFIYTNLLILYRNNLKKQDDSFFYGWCRLMVGHMTGIV